MNATVTCEKCGKPLGMFDGNICNECENRAVLEQIRKEIRQIVDEETEHDETWARGLHYSLCVIDKYR